MKILEDWLVDAGLEFEAGEAIGLAATEMAGSGDET